MFFFRKKKLKKKYEIKKNQGNQESHLQTSEERRFFIKNSILAAVSVFFIPHIFFKKNLVLAEAPTLPLLKESDPLAVSLGYRENANKVDSKKWAKKAGPDGKLQKCSNCMFYSMTKPNIGKCQLFPANWVKAQGWCNSWIKKA